MSTLQKQEARAKEMYDAERAKTHNLIDTLEEARSAIARNTEPWYYTGNQLLGRLDSVITAEWNKEYNDYVNGAQVQGLTPHTLEQYKELARNVTARR